MPPKKKPAKAAPKSAAQSPTSPSTAPAEPTETVANSLVLPPSAAVSPVPTDDAPEEQTVADPSPLGARAPEPLGQCANCTRPAVVRTNFSFAESVSYCGVCLPSQYGYLLGG